MWNFMQDIRYGWRMLLKSPAITLVALVTLALGIGANVAIFSFVDELWLRPMPVPQSDRLVRVFTSSRSDAGETAEGLSSYPDFLDIRAQSKALSGLAALDRRGAQFKGSNDNRLIPVAVVSNNFFDVLQVTPALGRTFTEPEMQSSTATPVLLSYPFWRRQFAGDSSIVNRTIVLDGRDVLVVGVLPRGFRGSEAYSVPDVWMPLSTWAYLTGETGRTSVRAMREYDLFGRLSPGTAVQQANAELATIAANLAGTYPASNAGRKMTALLETQSRGEVAPLSKVLLAIAAFVFLIACGNVAGLLIARAEARRSEIAIRAALGASRTRIIRQLLTEAALLGLTSCALALLLGQAALQFLPLLLPQSSFGGVDAHLNLRALLVAFVTALSSVIVFGLFPAWDGSRIAPSGLPRQHGASGGSVRARARSVLVVAQVAFSLVLVVGAGLMVRTILKQEALDPGFNAHQNMLVMELVPYFREPDERASHNFVVEARRRLEALPGVAATTIARRLPFGISGGGATRKVFFPGMASVENQGLPIHYDPIGDRFFEVLGSRMIRGRTIDGRDLANNARVMVVNETMARRFWPHQSGVGEHVWLDRANTDPYEVIGVVEDAKYSDFNEEPTPLLYVPLPPNEYGELALGVKTSIEPGAVAEAVRRTLWELNPEVTVIYMVSLREHMQEAMWVTRLTTALIAALGCLGLLLAAVGLYGLMAFLAGCRTQEIGIRLALGAQRRAIFQMMLGHAFTLTGIGVVVGAIAAIVATPALRSFLFGVSTADPITFLVALLVLTAVGFGAAFLPAWRATRVDPNAALRCE